MLSKEQNNVLHELFFDLVAKCGLSPLEAISYGLTRVMGFSPMEASVIINDIMGKSVTNSQVSVYLQRGAVKLSVDDAIYIRRKYLDMY